MNEEASPGYDAGYSQGVEDTCDKVLSLILGGDILELDEVTEFLEAEKGWKYVPTGTELQR